MGRLNAALLLLAAAAATAAAAHPPAPPSSFTVGYNFTLPFTATFQPDALTYVVTLARDGPGGRAAQTTDGNVVIVVDKSGSYSELSPRIHKLACTRYAADDEGDALVTAPVVPDVAKGGWAAAGTAPRAAVAAAVGGSDLPLLTSTTAHAWRLTAQHGERSVEYEFWSDAESGAPVALRQAGPDLLSGSHFDDYRVVFTQWDPTPPPDAAFDEPPECDGAPPPAEEQAGGPRRRSAGAGAAVLPSFGAAPRLASVHTPAPGAAYTTAATAGARPWLSDAEFRAAMLRPKRGRTEGLTTTPRKTPSARLPHTRRLPKSAVPAAVDWRGTPAAGVVKDQATCGSCWAFGTTGAVEAALSIATGKNVSLSEQQLMDCSWNYGTNSACGGGDADAAIDWIVAENGGRLAREADYEYKGVAAWCAEGHRGNDGVETSTTLTARRRHHHTPRIAGYAFVPAGDDEAVMEAVASRGPLQVSIDAAAHGFRFYSSGVYDEPTCRADEDGLDHSVTLVGYGTDSATGLDYWIVKNSWSTHWGDGGFVKIARRRGGCGVATAAMYAVVEGDEGGVSTA